MTEAEQRYAQIEKEALATVWACEIFSLYILGRRISIETDHKPLLGHKRLHNLPPRVLRFRLRLMRLDYSIEHTPGKFLYTVDVLSRSPLPNQPDKYTIELHKDVEHFISAITSQLPASNEWLPIFAKAQSADRTCSKVIDYCKHGWPSKYKVPTVLMVYWKCRGQFSLHNELLVIPSHLHTEILTKIHQGHQGIRGCRLRLVTSVWWPGASKDIETLIQSCPQCCKIAIPRKEPLMTSSLPVHPWETVAADLFEPNGTSYLLVVDYFSRFPEVVKLTSTTFVAYIPTIKGHFLSLWHTICPLQ